MKKKLTEILQCPTCNSNLKLNEITNETTEEIREGSLQCIECGEKFEVRKGIVDLLPKKLNALVNAEKEGWMARAKAKNWYDVSDDYLLALPNPKNSNEEVDWKKASDPFYYIVDQAFTDWKGKKVLDVGAGKPWSSRHLANKEAEVVSTDILEDNRIGLGVADVYIKHDKKFFERVLADMNVLPFKNQVFDVVLYQGALHHSINLWNAIKEADRVLKHEGHIIFTSEGSGGILSRESINHPTEDGLNEHNYKNLRYIWYLKKLGYKINTYQEPSFYEKHGNNKIWNMAYEVWRFARGGMLILIAKKGSK